MSDSGGDSSYEQSALNNDINVVPMCDVMLVLLIIFMIVTPTLLQGFQATLPMGDNLLERPEDESRVIVGIDIEGNWYFNKKPITRDNMLPTLQSGVRGPSRGQSLVPQGAQFTPVPRCHDHDGSRQRRGCAGVGRRV